MPLSLAEALALSERQRNEWTLLGWDVALQAPVYGCCRCGCQRFTVVTPGARLPATCPKCGARQDTPPGPFPPPVPAVVKTMGARYSP